MELWFAVSFQVRQTLPVATRLPYCTQSYHSLPSVPNGARMVVRRKVFCTSLASNTNCPNLKFHYARTAVYNQVCRVLATSLCKHLADHWTLYQGKQLIETRLTFEIFPMQLLSRAEGKFGFTVCCSQNESLKVATWFYIYYIPQRKLILDQEVQTTLIHELKNCQRPMIKCYRCTILSWIPAVDTRDLLHQQSLQDDLEFLGVPCIIIGS